VEIIDCKAWDKKEQKMIPDFTNYAGWKARQNMENVWRNDRYVKLLYTGLDDCNGNKIYDGDIIKVIQVRDDSFREFITDIAWEDCAFVAKDYEKDYYDTFLGAWVEPDVPLVELKIIGNKYENPELLEEDNDV